MRHLQIYFIIMVLALTGCSVDYSPDCRGQQDNAQAIEVAQVETARRAWNILSNPSRKKEWPQATQDYNQAVLAIVEHMRCEWKKHRDIFSHESAPYVIVKPTYAEGFWTRTYEDAIPCQHIETDLYLKERVYVEGMGIPLAGMVKTNHELVKNQVIKDNGNVHTITAILDFNRTSGGKPTLKVLPRMKVDTIQVGRIKQPLAGDFTAPIAMFWKKSSVQNYALLGLFNPSKALVYKGLYFAEPYDPDKIPVLFVHGLMSSPSTFADLANRLLADPLIRKNYQFWYFGYPSGLPWLVPARDLRSSLNQIFAEYDPHGRSPNANRMIMVGHSMGGLITRLNNSTKPWTLIPYMVKDCEQIKNYSYQEALSIRTDDNMVMQRAAESLVFEPNPRIKRIVFMATPHKGSDFANRWFGLLGQKLVRLPKTFLEEITKIGTLNKDMLLLNPTRITEEFTSIGQLSPTSAPIKGVQNVYPVQGMPVHSIIGDRGRNNTPYSSDGVVDYYSSHLHWSVSERIVPASHSVQDCIDTALEMRRILREHLQHEGISTKMSEDNAIAPTIWEDNPTKYSFQQPTGNILHLHR